MKQTDAITRHVVTAEELKRIPVHLEILSERYKVSGVARPNMVEGSIVVRVQKVSIRVLCRWNACSVYVSHHGWSFRNHPSFIDDIGSFQVAAVKIWRGHTSSGNVRTDTNPTEGTKAQVRVDFLDGGLAIEQRINDEWIVRGASRAHGLVV